MAKKGLGRGLGALIPDNLEIITGENEDNTANKIVEIQIKQIEPNKYQPRKSFKQEALEELAKSIEEHGIVQPIVVCKVGKKYQLVAGERRWRAAKLAGLDKIPAIIKDFTPQEITEIALIENIQREDLNPIEEASAYKVLLDEFKLTQEELSHRVGKSRSHIANTLRLLNTPITIQHYITSGKLTAGHARALLPLPEAGQLRLAEKIISEGLSVRETESLVKSITAIKEEQKNIKKKKADLSSQLSADLLDLEDRLKSYFGTKVRLINEGQKGKIEIEFYNEDDLIRIIDLIKVS